jgi:hypothetical protein
MPQRPGCLRVEPLPKIIQGQLSQLLKLGLATGARGAPRPQSSPVLGTDGVSDFYFFLPKSAGEEQLVWRSVAHSPLFWLLIKAALPPPPLSPFLISLVEGPAALPFQSSQGPHQMHEGTAQRASRSPLLAGITDCEEARVCGEQTRRIPQK